MAHSGVLYISERRRGPPKRHGAGVTYPLPTSISTGLGRSVTPCPRLMALHCQRSAEEAPSKVPRMLRSQLLRGRPCLRFQKWWGGQPSDASTWQHKPWLAGTASDLRHGNV